MIRILVAVDLGFRTMDRLNEIPEFEIIENSDLPGKQVAAEIADVDAVIAGTMSQLPPALLAGAVGLKIIILNGGKPDPMDTAKANQKHIEIRTAAAENQGHEGSDVIAILKDFFNV